jgi:hypothetical protein
VTVTIPESARLTTPLMERTLCPACHHYHREAMARKCDCCAELKPADPEWDKPKQAAKPRKRKPTEPAPKPDPVHLIPHVWLQNCDPFPPRLAGQLFTSDGRPAVYNETVGQFHHFRLAPIWTQPRTQEGADALLDQLLADAQRVQKGAA